MNLKNKIASTINIGGIDYSTKFIKNIDRGNTYGTSNQIQSIICLAETALENESLSEGKTTQVYWHEIIHIILDSIGKCDLSQDEPFVDSLAHAFYNVVSNTDFKTIGEVKQLIEKEND